MVRLLRRLNTTVVLCTGVQSATPFIAGFVMVSVLANAVADVTLRSTMGSERAAGRQKS